MLDDAYCKKQYLFYYVRHAISSIYPIAIWWEMEQPNCFLLQLFSSFIRRICVVGLQWKIYECKIDVRMANGQWTILDSFILCLRWMLCSCFIELQPIYLLYSYSSFLYYYFCINKKIFGFNFLVALFLLICLFAGKVFSICCGHTICSFIHLNSFCQMQMLWSYQNICSINLWITDLSLKSFI